MFTLAYDQIIEAARQTAADEAAREVDRARQAAILAETRAANPPLTRDQVEAIGVGDRLAQTLDTDGRGVVRPGARWVRPREILAISYRGVSVKGSAYVGGCCRFGDPIREDGTPNTSTISFSLSEGDACYRVTSRPE